MDVYKESNYEQNFTEFQDDAYLEYRQRVLDEIANDLNNKIDKEEDEQPLEEEEFVAEQMSFLHASTSLPVEEEPQNGAKLLKSTSETLIKEQEEAREVGRVKSLTTWSSFDEHIEKASLVSSKASSLDNYKQSTSTIPSSYSKRKKRRSSQRRNYDLKSELDNLKPYKPLKTWSERKSSSSNQSLKICYVNNTTSSEDETSIDQSDMNNVEMQARLQLAEARIDAKLKYEEEEKNSHLPQTIAYKILKVSLPEEMNRKLVDLQLDADDLDELRLGQLQLVLNDMMSRKQALSNKLVEILIVRDQLKIENEAKLIEVEDIKAIMEAVGPETSV